MLPYIRNAHAASVGLLRPLRIRASTGRGTCDDTYAAPRRLQTYPLGATLVEVLAIPPSP